MRKFFILVLCVVGYHLMAADTLKVKTTDPIVTKPRITNLNDILGPGFYPVELRQQGIEGEVLVDIWIDENGRLVKFNIAKSTNDQLEKIVISKLAILEFEPAKTKFGASVGCKTQLPFQFSLDIH